jgi:uncharacterized repeat protein (TIGR01451 family)
MGKKIWLSSVLLFGVVAIAWGVGTDAGSVIQNGGDDGDNTADAPGETVASYEVGGSARAIASNVVETIVVQVYGGQNNQPSDGNVLPGASVDYAYQVTNIGNGSDTYGLAAEITASSGGTWTAELYNAAGTDTIDTTGPLAEDATFNFILRVTAPAGAGEGDTCTVEVTITGSTSDGGSYTGDNGNTYGGDDTLTDTTLTTCTAALVRLEMSVAVSEPGGTDVNTNGSTTDPVPGATITYTIVYDNEGTSPAESFVLTQLLSAVAGGGVTYVSGSAAADVHAGGVTIQFSDDNGATWDLDGNANPEQVTGIRWIFDTNVAATDGDPTDSCEDESPAADDTDAGTVTYQVTID